MADLSMGPAGGLTGWLTMQQGLAPVIDQRARLGQYLQDEPLKRAQMQADIQAQQYKNQIAPQQFQSSQQGTPFEQQQFAQAAQQQALQRQMTMMQFQRQQSLAEETLRHNRQVEANAAEANKSKTKLEALREKQAAWKMAMDAYNSGMGPHPGSMPTGDESGLIPQVSAQKVQTPVFNPDAPNPMGPQPGGRPEGGIEQKPAVIPVPEDLAKLPPGPRMKIVAARVEERPHANAALNEALANLDRMAEQAKAIADNKMMPMATGMVGMAYRNLPGYEGKAIDAQLTSLKAQTAFATLNQLRSQSKTGGALGQVSNQEENMLANSISALDPQQDADNFRKGLVQLQRYTAGAKDRLIRAYKATYGVEPDLKKYDTVVSPNEKIGQTAGPAVGAVIKGYRFKGGNPADQSSWEKE